MELKDRLNAGGEVYLVRIRNPFNGIERGVSSRYLKAVVLQRIHLMELKASLGLPISSCTSSLENPFNGIERQHLHYSH